MHSLTADERHDFAREIAVIARRWRSRLDERLKFLDMSQARWVALYWLGRSPGGVSQATLAERTAVEAPTLVRILDQLESQGFLKREPAPGDRRVKLLYLTTAAEPIFAQIDAIAEELRREVMAEVSVEEFHKAMSILKRVRSQLD